MTTRAWHRAAALGQRNVESAPAFLIGLSGMRQSGIDDGNKRHGTNLDTLAAAVASVSIHNASPDWVSSHLRRVTFLLWTRQGEMPHAIGEIEAIRVDVASPLDGILMPLPKLPEGRWALYDTVEANQRLGPVGRPAVAGRDGHLRAGTGPAEKGTRRGRRRSWRSAKRTAG